MLGGRLQILLKGMEMLVVLRKNLLVASLL